MFKILSDSACDLSSEYVKKHNVELIPLYITSDGEHYKKDVEEIYSRDLYDKVVNEKCFLKTSLPSVQDYADHFMQYVSQGIPVLCITISTSLSGSYNSAQSARELIMEEYPDARITVINSTTNTVTQGLFVNEAVRMAENGLSYEQTIEKLEKLKASTRIFFTIGTLEYLIKNGRIGKLANLITSKIKIKPVIIMKNNELGLGGVSRTRANSISSVIDITRKFLNDPQNNKNDFIFAVGWGYNLEEAASFKSRIENTLGIETIGYTGSQIGSVTLCHTGPDAIGIGCIRKYETL